MERLRLILLPGMDGTGLMFEPFVVALRDEFDITVVSYPTTQPLGYAELQAIAREAIPSHGPCVLLGESFSGPIAVGLAASASPRLRGLILCGSFVRTPRPALSFLRPCVRLLPLGWLPTAGAAFLLFGRFSTSALRQLLARALQQVAPAVMRKRLRDVVDADVSGQLAAVRVPVLYLRATQDRLVPPAASAWIAHLNPGTQIEDIVAPHCLLQAAPEASALIIGDFLRGLQAPV